MKARYIHSIRKGTARVLSAVESRLPAPVWLALRRTGRLASRRRRSLALPLVVAFHAGMVLWFSNLPPQPVPTYPIVMDVMLFPGSGPGSSIATAPAAGDPRGQDDAPAESSVSETVQSAGSTGEAVAAAPAVTPTDDRAADAELPDDVLAMVEAMVGATSAKLAQPVTMMQPAGQTTEWTPSQPGGDGGGCGIDHAIQARMIVEPAIQTALAGVPRDSRSVANAIQLWDGAWIPSLSPEGEPALAALRKAIAETVAEAPISCRNQDILGPRFLIVSHAGGSSTVLVVGSGLWRWGDLSPETPPGFLRWLGFSQP